MLRAQSWGGSGELQMLGCGLALQTPWRLAMKREMNGGVETGATWSSRLNDRLLHPVRPPSSLIPRISSLWALAFSRQQTRREITSSPTVAQSPSGNPLPPVFSSRIPTFLTRRTDAAPSSTWRSKSLLYSGSFRRCSCCTSTSRDIWLGRQHGTSISRPQAFLLADRLMMMVESQVSRWQIVGRDLPPGFERARE